MPLAVGTPVAWIPTLYTTLLLFNQYLSLPVMNYLPQLILLAPQRWVSITAIDIYPLRNPLEGYHTKGNSCIVGSMIGGIL